MFEARTQPLFRRDQSLSHEVAIVSRWVIEASEFLVAEFLVKAAGLKAERVQPCRVAAALAGSDFRRGHQFPSHASAAEVFRNPEVFDE
jgi:hypothetical protein